MSVQIMALVLRELATNARKHGALAAREGRLAVTWLTTHHDSLTIEWLELGNAAGVGGVPPTRKGFGRRLIEEALPYQFDAQTRLDFQPNGVLCSVTIPLDWQRTQAER
jgi:two-component sensor histidine kinase